MRPKYEQKGLLRRQNIILDVREAVIGQWRNGKDLTLSGYYQLVNSDRAVDRIRDAVAQLIEARKNPYICEQIGIRRDSLSSAFTDSLRWVSEPIKHNGADDMAKAVDSAITTSVTMRNIQQAAYGNIESGRG